MSRTAKTEWSRPDGFHLTNRLERQARSAGRLRSVVEFELAADEASVASGLPAGAPAA